MRKFKSVWYERDGEAAVITLNRPEKRNALSRVMMAELLRAIGNARRDPAVRVLILTGAGPAFCAGMDLGEMLQTAERKNPHRLWRVDAAQYHRLIRSLLDLPKPVIAAVNGTAVAGGAGLVLASDFVVASKDAAFGLPEVKRGLVAGMVEPLLAFRIGNGAAARLVLYGKILKSRAAERSGIFHEVIPRAKLMPRARAIGRKLAEGAPRALAETKRRFLRLAGKSLAAQLDDGMVLSARARGTPEAQEGLAAFLEKRSPRWFAVRL